MDGAAQRVGLLGWPLGHSISPALHNAAFAALGLPWQYDLLPVPPGDLAAAMTRLVEREGYRGFNVTIPHKRAVLTHSLVGAQSEAVRATGAANTLIVQPDGSLRAENTDWRGFADDLAAHGVNVTGATCVILGTGGSAQAITFALQQGGAAAITAISRDPGGRAGVASYADLARLALRANLIVNCTPLGMSPRVEGSPWPDEVPFPLGAVLYDLVYNPPVTRLMRQAQSAGARAVGGLGMLVRQAALAFALWTGSAPPLAVMQDAARHALRESAPPGGSQQE